MENKDANTAVRSRTRRAILDAAIQVLGENSAASLSDIAQAADVGRTTLHRYFPSRTDLLQAMSADAFEQTEMAVTRARLEEGTAREALQRLCEELFDLGDLLMLVFSFPEVTESLEWEEESPSDRAVMALIERGHQDGTIDPQLPADWISTHVIWAMMYSGWGYARSGSVSRHEALRLVTLTINRVITPDD